MQSLREIQRDFARAILSGDDAPLVALIASDDIGATVRAEVYRNNVLSSLSGALAEMFPVVRRLVGDGFFDFAAHEFIRHAPPRGPCVADYGSGFADFLSDFPPCRELGYLADVARFERLLHDAARLGEGTAIDAAALTDVAAADAGYIVFRFAPSFGYLSSAWPVAAIWRANQPDADGGIDPRSTATRLEVRRREGVVEFRELSSGEFSFRATLAGAGALSAALEAAMASDTSFDAGRALADLFADHAVTDFHLIKDE